jgi:hypothetical protein
LYVKIPGPDNNSSIHPNKSLATPGTPDSAQFTVKFPGAGKVLGTQPSPAGYQQYAGNFHAEENNLSEWAPFSAHLEWEVARWATAVFEKVGTRDFRALWGGVPQVSKWGGLPPTFSRQQCSGATIRPPAVDRGM